ncbi:MerR family transcriptional regulator [Desulforamulus ruminis]|uniref:Regulatory protein MerR n=1 Tax=Desulforamulus ruminis (strain ATCC 23193 / DSM 2154 / NCIMB 8452 / DL) TaxID=696281 RepID=F6DV95_DESRL|nr:MerR family transcriptional regulator [Desulforamulus ruminis]AEG60248.1 regulatory protein MerR [Desulforamulus ruminis DSM 2154]
MFCNDDQPMFNIGVIAELLKVHPETLRIWEKHGLVEPSRRNKQRLYSNNDVKRLQFIHYLINDKGLNIAGVLQIISMYPCWTTKHCPGANSSREGNVNVNKPCWKEQGTFCFILEDITDHCSVCPHYKNDCQLNS